MWSAQRHLVHSHCCAAAACEFRNIPSPRGSPEPASGHPIPSLAPTAPPSPALASPILDTSWRRSLALSAPGLTPPGRGRGPVQTTNRPGGHAGVAWPPGRAWSLGKWFLTFCDIVLGLPDLWGVGPRPRLRVPVGLGDSDFSVEGSPPPLLTPSFPSPFPAFPSIRGPPRVGVAPESLAANELPGDAGHREHHLPWRAPWAGAGGGSWPGCPTPLPRGEQAGLAWEKDTETLRPAGGKGAGAPKTCSTSHVYPGEALVPAIRLCHKNNAVSVRL